MRCVVPRMTFHLPGLIVGLVLLAAPPTSLAQQAATVPRVGFLMGGGSGPDPRVEAFRQGFRELGYVDGKTIAIEWRFADGQEGRFAPLARELVGLKVDAIVTDGSQATHAAQSATKTIPIVMASESDPVRMGTVASFARPGGNITGLTSFNAGLSAKRLELLRDALPGITRVGIMWNPENPQNVAFFQETQIAARTLGMQLQSLEVRGPGDFEGAFRAAVKARAGAVSVLSDALMFRHRARLLALAAKHKIPTIHTHSLWAEAGGFMSYGANFADLWRRAATYVDKILKGANPADLPIQQPTKFEFVLNVKTAKALGITVPSSVQSRADGIIR